MKLSVRNTAACALIITGLIIAVVLGEALLRLVGAKPWKYLDLYPNEPTMHEPHPVLGWRNKVGSYTVPPYHPSGNVIHLTFLENGLRRTGENPSQHAEGELVVVGCSFTQGWAISDNETYAWKLQQQYASMHVLNYGTGGYGTYQSLLVLERELPRLTSPRIVLYGFTGDHEDRNVAPSEWLRNLSLFSRRGHVAVPFATFDENQGLIRQPPARYLMLPLRESSAAVALLERAYMKLATVRRHGQKTRVTQEILLQMEQVSKKYGAEFFVVLLEGVNREQYIKFFSNNRIRFIDCLNDLSDEMRVPGEGHPNGRMHSLWAQCIQNGLAKVNDSVNMANNFFIPTSPSVR